MNPAPRDRLTVTTAPRAPEPPVPHAAVGVGVIVTDEEGRLLLGRHRSGVHELPGGKVEGGEPVAEAAVRELAEETGLVALAEDVEVLAMLLDEVGGVTRVTMAARVHRFTGRPFAAEPHLVSRWTWHAPEQLPSPLFVPSGQVLSTWRPDLPIAHPEVSVYHLTQTAAQH
ncbi:MULTISPECIES: nucleotide triphosphate diphosphatase NUDT15 [Streptomyces]|uniref:Putative MutT-family protein n=1 Tax=Streptomyces albus (strain ATCC 21838 / DSM 41398 / FERM P-419 / JCM 4703 / NBRC 107858) TaxID=1081613 RepID=A0A0B5ENA3_STRA4|nr:NUDIX domain-containing protein [Streptomyces sp. SCSIO ZS0520]AJE83099.1 putative MutT-family protein [Streptomyces albus]AOU77410.1 putative MutT-family protein [Streptomyces albus]AYN33183.1 putative MutT-family protein [Streptomyces albus]